MTIFVLEHFTPENDDFVEADAFVRPIYRPKDATSEKILEEFLASLGLSSDERHKRAMASVVVACRAAARKGGRLLGYPGNANYYAKTGYSYPVAMRLRDALIEQGYLKRVSRQGALQSVVFEVKGLDLDGRYQSDIPWPVRTREKKRPGADRGHTLTRKECIKRFGGRYRDAERRMERLNQAYGSHPLCSPDGTAWGGAYRIFNDGRLDRGGRIYGDWQQLKEEERLKLEVDGEPLVEIDITACFLFILSAKSGCPITDKDPYKAISWVVDKPTRDLAKVMVAAIISTDGPLSRFPAGLRGKYSIHKGTSISDLQDPILSAFPQLRTPAISGMQAMYEESEAVFATIERLIDVGIYSYPVHDCLLVEEKSWETAVNVLQDELERHFGAKPWLTVTFPSGAERSIDPSAHMTIRLSEIIK